jgi:serine/threonine protein phosphatase 1
MLDALRNIFRSGSRGASAPLPSVPPGQRYYVIGDIHGRLDLYEALIEGIEADDANLAPRDTHVVLLGDLIDRGPESAGVIERTRQWQAQREVRVLVGNHEEMLLEAVERPEVLKHFLRHGGRETVLSYGLTRKQYSELTIEELLELVRELIPEKDLEYIRTFDEYIVAGDYLFVHAGIDPMVPLAEQSRRDMLWIRDRFLNHEGPLEKVVVHGHTIFDTVLDCGNRIGIDTGAFRSGVLSALMLEDDQKRVMQAIDDNGHISIFHGDRSR